MELSLEIFFTASLSFMLTFAFAKLVSMASASQEDLHEPQLHSKPKPKPKPKSPVKSTDEMSLDEEYFVRQEEDEDEVVNGESVEVRRFQRTPDPELVRFEDRAAGENKRSVEFRREIMVEGMDSEYFRDELIDGCGFGGKSEIEIEADDGGEVESVREGGSEIGDWEAIERKDLEGMIGSTDIAVSG